MKFFIVLIITSLYQLSFGQSANNKNLLSNYSQFDVVLEYSNDFNNDGIKDVLYILSSKKENDQKLINNNDSLSKRKTVIYVGNKNNKFVKIFDCDNIFPCRKCLGKSDNYVSDLKFENNVLSYTTSIAPFASNSYSVIDFTLKLKNNNFSITNYQETYFAIETDDSVKIALDNKDFSKQKFNYYDWVADKSWLDWTIISSNNLTKINDFAYELEKINPSTSINVFQKIIKKFPNRTVAYLNLADSFWLTGNKDLAKENYKKYISLMKSQNKDLSKIPKQVWERIK